MAEGFRPSTLWDRVAAWIRDDLQIILPVAGAFFFLPSVIFTRFLPQSQAEFSAAMIVPMLLILVFQTIGQLSIFGLLLDPRNPTVRDALQLGLRRLIAAIGAQLMIFAMLCGLLLVGQIIAMLFGGASVARGGGNNAAMMRLAAMGLVIVSPAILYLLARLAVVFPVLVRERLTPVVALRRAFALTQGNGWKIVGLILIVTSLYLLVQVALTAAFGSVFGIAGRLLGLQAVAELLTLILVSALGTAGTVIITAGLGFIYRDLAR